MRMGARLQLTVTLPWASVDAVMSQLLVQPRPSVLI